MTCLSGASHDAAESPTSVAVDFLVHNPVHNLERNRLDVGERTRSWVRAAMARLRRRDQMLLDRRKRIQFDGSKIAA
jgi:hypothetical protein